MDRLKPHLCKEGLPYLVERLGDAETYVEYGSGGSTLLALELGVSNVIVAESDPGWVEKIREQAEDIVSGQQRLFVEYCDVGPVGPWGTPTTFTEDQARNYVSAVWDRVQMLGVRPDVVLIDGRFRVACFMQTLLKAQSHCEIIMDDYMRQEYFVVEDVCKLKKRIGRFGIFESTEERNLSRIEEILGSHLSDPS